MQYPNQYTSYIQLRSNTYYFRFKIPTHLKQYTPKRELTKSLKTDSFSLACAKVAQKLNLISKVKAMHFKRPPYELQGIFDELTDFSDVPNEYSDEEVKSRFINASEKQLMGVQADLATGGGTYDFSWDYKSLPDESNLLRYQAFERIFVILTQARINLANNGLTSQHYVDMDEARVVLSEINTPTPIMKAVEHSVKPDVVGASGALNTPVFSLEDGWSQFKAYKADWTKKIVEQRQRDYDFLTAYWGADKDLNVIRKADVRKCFYAYSRMPKGNVKPYNKMIIAGRYEASLNEIPEEGVISAKTANDFMKTLQSFFSTFLTGHLDTYQISPTDKIKKLTEEDRRYGIYTDSEIAKLIASALTDSDLTRKWMIILAVYTGARASEVIKFLKDGAKIHPLSKIPYFELSEGKTKSAKRKIPLHPFIIKSGFLDIGSLVLTDKQPTRWMHALLDNLDIAKFDTNDDKRLFHSLRHTFITKAISSGIEKTLVQTYIGHSKQLGITDRYVHDIHLEQLMPVIEAIKFNDEY